MKIWIDDVRVPPDDSWLWCKTVNETIGVISKLLYGRIDIDVISIDHDAGDYAYDGGDYIKVLDWLEENGYKQPTHFHIHSMNPVGVYKMRSIIKRNNWREVYEV